MKQAPHERLERGRFSVRCGQECCQVGDLSRVAAVKDLVRLRSELPALRRSTYGQVDARHDDAFVSIASDGLLCLFNAADEKVACPLPEGKQWKLAFASSECVVDEMQSATLDAQSVAILVSG